MRSQLLMLLLLLLSCFGRVWLCATPQTAAHQAPPSLGFSRQEHWSGLPFPSPTHESEKGKWSRSVMPDSSRPHGLQPTRLLRPRDFPGKSTGVGCHCLLHMLLRFLHMSWVPLSCCFQDFIFSFGFQQFDYIMCLGVNLWVYPMWSFWTSWIYRWIFSIKFVKFSAIISSGIFYLPFSHSPFIMVVLEHLLVSHWFVRLCSFFFIFFFFSSPDWILIHPSSSSQIPFWLFTFTV